MTTPTDTKNQDAAALVGLDDAPEFYDDAKKIQKPYGLKRHDEICDHLEQVQRMSEADVVTASVGIWMGIESERQHKNKQLIALREENAKLKETISFLPKVPTQPYEKELAQELAALRAENERLKAGGNEWLLERVERDLAAERENSKKLVEALNKIKGPIDCGCRPCTGQCKSEEALRIYIEEIQEISREALAAHAESEAK